MKYKVLLIVTILLLCTSCSSIKNITRKDNEFQTYLESIGFTCEDNLCERNDDFTDYSDEYYFAYGHSYTFDFNVDAFHTGYYEFGQNDGNITSTTGAHAYTYYWDDDTARSKNVTGNGRYEYNCSTTEIEMYPLFGMSDIDTCRNLNPYGNNYRTFQEQCEIVKKYCVEGEAIYDDFINRKGVYDAISNY